MELLNSVCVCIKTDVGQKGKTSHALKVMYKRTIHYLNVKMCTHVPGEVKYSCRGV
jgi:hypothetical protein